jgi:predicted MFS family arabinose efflux permease
MEPVITPVDPTAPVSFGEVLGNRNFLLLWLGQLFSQLADKVFLIFMIALIRVQFSDHETTSNTLISWLYMAFSIPAVLFGSLAGVFVDRWSKRAVLAGTNILRGLLVLAIPFLPPVYGVLLVLTFLVSTLTQFFAPAETTTIPLIVERRSLLIANSLFTTTMMGSLIFGFALGEPLLALVSVTHGDWLVGGAYILAGIILLNVQTGEEKKHHNHGSVFKDIKEGLDYVLANALVRAAMVQLIVLFSIFAALSVLAVNLSQQVGLKQEQFGFLLAATGVGMALGAWLLGRFGNRLSRSQLAFGGSLVIAATLAGLALLQSLVPILVLCAILGVAAAAVGVPMQTVIQEETPPELRGKVFGLQNNAVNIALSLPLALVGLAADTFGLKTVIFTVALTALVAAFGLRMAQRTVKL